MRVSEFLFIVVIWVVMPSFCDAQKEGNIWMLGNAGPVPCENMGIDFNLGQMDTFSVCRPMNFFTTNSSICDTSGSLLFYTNGYELANGNHQAFQNSSGFNPSVTNPVQSELNIRQGTLILPVPKNDSLFYVFHVNGEIFTHNSNQEFQPLELRYSKVSITSGTSVGRILPQSKNQTLYSDTLVLGRLTATKHFNGYDYWLVAHKFWSDEYLVFHVMNDSIGGPIKQNVGSKVRYDSVGKCTFSQDGATIAMTGLDDFIDILTFDRCTGNITEKEVIKFSEPYMALDSLFIMDCEFSPNGRFLYVNNTFYMYQFDMTSDTISNSRIRIGEWDGLLSPFKTCFNDMQLAPDGKIYITTCEGTNRIHVIHNPNLKDTLADFEQNLLLPRFNANVLPNLINYHLDSITKQFCDSLTSNISIQENFRSTGITLFPNPTIDILNIKVHEKDLKYEQWNLSIIDLTGRIRFHALFDVNSSIIDVSSLPNGIYIAKIKCQYDTFSAKFIVQH